MAKSDVTSDYGEDSSEEDNIDSLVLKVKKISLEEKKIKSLISDDIHSQKGGTCYANAIATVLRAAESRIIGRRLTPHSDLVRQLVDTWGDKGANEALVFAVECPKRRLRFKQCIFVRDVDDALRNNRTLLAAFHLDEDQWARFACFFETDPDGVLTKDVVGEASTTDTWDMPDGHAMALCGTTTDYWILKNSWGDWADSGYCRIAKDAFAWEIYDVFYYQHELRRQDWLNYQRYDGERCNARSIAMVIRAAASRVIGRKTKSLQKLKHEILQQMETKSLEQILEAECSRRRLRYRKLKDAEQEEGAVISDQRPLLGVVELSEANWNKFVRTCIDDEVDRKSVV